MNLRPDEAAGLMVLGIAAVVVAALGWAGLSLAVLGT